MSNNRNRYRTIKTALHQLYPKYQLAARPNI